MILVIKTDVLLIAVAWHLYIVLVALLVTEGVIRLVSEDVVELVVVHVRVVVVDKKRKRPLVMRGQVYYFLISNGVIPTVLGFSSAGGLGIPVHCWLSMNSLRSEE